jgi:hypothetical protein
VPAPGEEDAQRKGAITSTITPVEMAWIARLHLQFRRERRNA